MKDQYSLIVDEKFICLLTTCKCPSALITALSESMLALNRDDARIFHESIRHGRVSS